MANNKNNKHKQVKTLIKLQIEGGKATPAPPVGPALGQHGINIMEFCKAYNEQTKDKVGSVIPVEITVFVDNTFEFLTKTPPVSNLIKKAINIKKGSQTPGREFVGKISSSKIKEIAEAKMPDLNAWDIGQAMKIIEGSARSMGIEVEQ